MQSRKTFSTQPKYIYLATVIRCNFEQISIILPNQLNNSNLLVVYLVIFTSASAKTNFLTINFVCSQQPTVYI